jgi:hypothetical protein
METVFMELTGRSVEEDEVEEEEGQPVAAGLARDRDKEGNSP